MPQPTPNTIDMEHWRVGIRLGFVLGRNNSTLAVERESNCREMKNRLTPGIMYICDDFEEDIAAFTSPQQASGPGDILAGMRAHNNVITT